MNAPEAKPEPWPEPWQPAALQQLLGSLQREPWAHDFFALVRRLDALRPDAPRTGQALRPLQEGLRFAQAPELDFAPAALQRLELREGAAPRLSVRFFGLLGPHGPMPLHVTEYLRERLHQHGDAAPAHFLDIFHHRLLSLFYAAWAQGQPVVQADRPAHDRYRAWLGAAAGLPPAGAGAGAVPAPALAYQAGLLAQRSRHPEALCKVLSQYFAVPVRVQQNIGQWLGIHRDDQSRLGHSARHALRAEHPGAQLGVNANAGRRVWDRQYRFRLCLGPLTAAQFRSFLPDGAAWKPLNEWVTLLAGAALGWELELHLQPAQRPAPRLGQPGLRLGVNTWLLPPAAAQASPPPPPPPPLPPPHTLRLRPGRSHLHRQALRHAAFLSAAPLSAAAAA